MCLVCCVVVVIVSVSDVIFFGVMLIDEVSVSVWVLWLGDFFFFGGLEKFEVDFLLWLLRIEMRDFDMSDEFFGFVGLSLKDIKEREVLLFLFFDDLLMEGFFFVFVLKLKVFKVNELFSDELVIFFFFDGRKVKFFVVVVNGKIFLNEDDYFVVGNMKEIGKNKGLELLS